MKKKIIHFIFNLGRGGAETMLVRVIKELDEYEHVVVTLFPLNHFGNELQCDKLICLNLSTLFSLPWAVFRFRKLVKKEQPAIVHTHLFWPTIIARAAVPKGIPLITTIHAFIATSVEYKKWYIRFLDKTSFLLRKSVIIGVAKGATKEYFSFLGIKPYKAYALYTFVDVDHFNLARSAAKRESEDFRLISIGALRVQKNHQFLIEAFKLLRNENILLHIYGAGPLKEKLQKQIDEAQVNIILKGMITNMNDVLPQYDLFVMSSTFEGFSLGVLETMAMKVPMLLSEIVSFREQCEDTARYFSLDDVRDFAGKVKALAADAQVRSELSERAYKRVIDNFTLQHHMKQLKEIYSDNLENN